MIFNLADYCFAKEIVKVIAKNIFAKKFSFLLGLMFLFWSTSIMWIRQWTRKTLIFLGQNCYFKRKEINKTYFLYIYCRSIYRFHTHPSSSNINITSFRDNPTRTKVLNISIKFFSLSTPFLVCFFMIIFTSFAGMQIHKNCRIVLKLH